MPQIKVIPPVRYIAAFLAGMALAVGLSYAYIPEAPSIEETCRTYAINWETVQRSEFNDPEGFGPAPESMSRGWYDHCMDVFDTDLEPYDDAIGPTLNFEEDPNAQS